jgi:hypothetical protein
MLSSKSLGTVGLALALAGCSSGGGGGADSGADTGGGASNSCVGQITVIETGEVFEYKAGNRIGGCGASQFDVMLTSKKDGVHAMSLTVGKDGSVGVTGGNFPSGSFQGTGASNTTTGTAGGANLYTCSGTITVPMVLVKAGSGSTTLTLDGKLDVAVSY